MNRERLRVVVLNYNHAAMTCRCVDSVLSQCYWPLDVVVVDNHSEWSDFSQLSRMLSREVRLVRTDCNLGYSAGNNIGIRFDLMPKPGYVMILNNDAVLEDRYTCKKLVAALENDATQVACSPLVDTVSTGLPPEMQIQVRRIPDYFALLVSSSWWLRRLPKLARISDWHVYQDARPFPLGRELVSESINGSCFVARQDFLEKMGGLDEGTFLYLEELILGKQMSACGARACLVTSTVVKHEQGSTSGHNQGRVRLDMSVRMVQSEIYYCRKYLGVSWLAILFLIFVRSIDVGTKLAHQRLRRSAP